MAGVAVAVVVAGACGLGDKDAQADRIVNAARSTATADLVSGTITVAITPVPPKYPSVVAAAIVSGGRSKATAQFRIENGRVAALAPVVGADTVFPFVRFDDRGVALRRPDAPPSDVRPWLEVVLDDLDEDSGRIETLEPGTASGLLAVFDPRVLVDLMAGPLAGSIEPRGTSEATSGHTTLAANFDFEKALTDTREAAYDDDRLERTRLVLELLRVRSEPAPGSIVLSPDGDVQSFLVTLNGEINRETRFKVQVGVEMHPPTSGDLDVGTRPPPGATVRTSSLIPLVRAAGTVVAEVTTTPPIPPSPPAPEGTDG